jgi:hypothetical protein
MVKREHIQPKIPILASKDIGEVVVVAPLKLVDWVATIFLSPRGDPTYDPSKEILERRRLKAGSYHGNQVAKVSFPKVFATQGLIMQIDNGLSPIGLASDRFPGEEYATQFAVVMGGTTILDFRDTDRRRPIPKVIE